MKILKIGQLKLKNPLVLAPMLNITDLPYREICRKAGASLCYSEMVHVSALLHENEKTKQMLLTNEKDMPLGIQITGSSLKDFKKAIPLLKKYTLVDLNCGCPSERIKGSKAGSYLLNSPMKIFKIVRLLKSSGLIVTAKIRLGYAKNNALEIAKTIEKAGADAIIVHARLANQGYDSKADWQWIRKIKESVRIPVIGNGDVFSGKDAKKMLGLCDGVMIARGAIGNPLIFNNILYYLKTGKERKIDFGKNLNLFLEYLDLCLKYDLVDLPKIKHLACHFIKGIEGAAKIRDGIMKCKDFEGIRGRVEELV